jgi:hypothetical protein
MSCNPLALEQQAWLASSYLERVAESLYQFEKRSTWARLSDLPAPERMKYRSAAGRAIAALQVGEESPHRRAI